MKIMFFLMVLIMFIIILLLMINSLLMKKNFSSREKLISLECGFTMMNSFNLPFSIQFYYISLLFLIFDIEIALFMTFLQKLNFYMIYNWVNFFIMMNLILLFGLYFEWKNNFINWF